MSHVTHINESRNTYECVTSHESSYQWIVSSIQWVMSHVWMSRVTHTNESRHTYECVTSRVWMSHVTHMNESRHTYEWVTSHIWMSHLIFFQKYKERLNMHAGKHVDPTKKARDFAGKIAYIHIYTCTCMYIFIFTCVHIYIYIFICNTCSYLQIQIFSKRGWTCM